MLVFKNPDVAAKYKSTFVGNPIVHLPGKKGTGFRIKLADATIDQADRLFARKGQNLLQLNDAPPAKPAEIKKNNKTELKEGSPT